MSGMPRRRRPETRRRSEPAQEKPTKKIVAELFTKGFTRDDIREILGLGRRGADYHLNNPDYPELRKIIGPEQTNLLEHPADRILRERRASLDDGTRGKEEIDVIIRKEIEDGSILHARTKTGKLQLQKGTPVSLHPEGPELEIIRKRLQFAIASPAAKVGRSHLTSEREMIYNLARKGFSRLEIAGFVELPEANVRYHLKETARADPELKKILEYKHPLTGRAVGREHPLNTIIRGRMIELASRNRTRGQIEEIIRELKAQHLKEKKLSGKQIEEKLTEARIRLLGGNLTKAQIDDIIRKEISTGEILLKHGKDGKITLEKGKPVAIISEGPELKLLKQKLKDPALSRDTMHLHREYIEHSNPELAEYLEVEGHFPELKIYQGLCGQVTKGLTFGNVPFMGLTTREIGDAIGVSHKQVQQYLENIRKQIPQIDDYLGLNGKIIKGIYFGKRPFKGLSPTKISDVLKKQGVPHAGILPVVRAINELERGHFPSIIRDLK